jgi:gamma-glutamyltranspeptidase/glutathione hydrolase
MARRGRGAVAAGHQETVKAAAEVLADGGNAFDAAIAGLWMACVAEPVLASPGGGGFLMALEAGADAARLYDFFVKTPQRKQPSTAIDFHAIHADFGTATQEFHIGHGATATPGYVPGLYAVHEDLGRLDMERLLRPAIKAAQDGHTVTPFQAFLSQVVSSILLATASSRALFAPHGALPADGGRFENPGLAGFFGGLADGGEDFYRATAVPALAAEQAAAGHLTESDFENYAVIKRAALTLDFSGARCYLNPPPSSGGAFIAHALMGYEAARGIDTTVMAHALERAEAARLKYHGDAAAILKDAGIDHAGAPTGGTVSRGTTHISVIDGEGNAASATVSNGEGNGYVAGGFGFMLNNMLGEEDLNPGGFHRWQPGRRLASNMCPVVAGGPAGELVALGSGGSNRIRSSVFQAMVRMLAGGEAPGVAVDAPRLHVENGHLDFEDLMDAATTRRLEETFAGRRAWAETNLFFGGVHAARRSSKGVFEAAGDRRRGGHWAVVE